MIGIYKILNKINNKIYIGQSWNIEIRWRKHKNNRKYYSSKNWHLYESFNKYGIENFEFSILHEIKIVEEYNKEKIQIELDYYEDVFIKHFNSRDREFGYNKREAGGRGKHSEESKLKNRESHLGKSVNLGVPKSEESKKKMSEAGKLRIGEKNSMFGKKHNDETKKKISEKAKLRTGEKNPFFGKTHTKETIEKIQKNRLYKKSKYKVFCHDNNKIYYSINDASKDLNLDCKKNF